MSNTDGFRVRVLGCGDAFASGGRFQSAFLLEIGNCRVLMDCGATTLVALRQAGLDPGGIDLILISHLHGDHFGGLPFFLLDQHFRAKRKRPLTIAGPSGIDDRLKQLLAITFPGSERLTFGFPFKVEAIDPDGPARHLGPVHVDAVAVEHPSGAPALGLRLKAGGRSLAYSGDTQWTDALVGLSRGADLLVCECYAYDRAANGHMNYHTLRARRGELTARRIVLTHMNAEMLARRADLDFETLSDGMLLEV